MGLCENYWRKNVIILMKYFTKIRKSKLVVCTLFFDTLITVLGDSYSILS